jgi:DUF4097 and DUF4098 domain-containing protein YvlB
MRFREVFLVVVLIVAGLVLYQYKTGHWNFDWNWGWSEDFGFVGKEVTAEETRTIEAPLPAAIEIENGHGWVEVRGGDQANVQVTFKKVIWRRKEEEAKEIADQLKYTVTAGADKLVFATNRDEFRKKNFETGFILTVPKSMMVSVINSYGAVRVEGVKEATVHNSHGEVTASNVDGPCVLETSYDDIEARDIKGTCRITDSHADVRAARITGDLSVETSYARIRVEDAGGKAGLRGSNTDVEARRVAGAVTVETSYEKVLLTDVGPAEVTGHNMAVTADNVRGDLKIETSYEPVRVTGVQGKILVDAHNSTVTAEGITGLSIWVRTSYENVSLADFSADVSVVCHNGNVVLRPRDLKYGMDVRDENGTIDLAWPSGERARLEARTKGGTVSWGLTDRPDVNETNGVSLVKAFSANASAPLVYLSTTYENIRIEEGGRKF